VGERTRVSLVGPAEVAVLSAVDDVLDVEVSTGTLVADFVHRNSGRLRIHSPGAITEVVGTLFSVEVRGTQSRISVAHGRVVVQPSEGAPRALSAGESWTSGTPAIEHLPAATAALLADHDAATRPGSTVATPPVASLKNTASAVGALMPAPAPHFAPAPPATTPAPVSATRGPAVVALATPARAQPAATPRPSPAGPTPTPPVEPAPAIAAPAPAPARTPEASYRDAETAMRRRDWTAARRALEQVATGGRNSALEDVARYELAQLAMRTGDQARAAHWLDTLLASDREPALRESTRYLRCEVRVRAGDTDDGRRCLESFRASYPGSTRDASALGWLLRLSPARPACAAVQALADEYLRRYPDGADASLARQRKAQCTP
jgi:TolA-binding protein